MPYKVIENKKTPGTYKVTNKNTGMIIAYATRNPQSLIAAIEINKKLHGKNKKK
jgi:hypothetical protein